MNIGIVGLGLMGGSYAKAFKKINKRVFGWDIDQNIVNQAFEEGVIVNNQNDLSELKKIDILFICLHPDQTLHFIKTYQDHFKVDAIVTDIIGLKNDFMKAVQEIIRDDVNFIGGHPMAGREGMGFSCAHENIFEAANYLLIEGDVEETYYIILQELIYEIGCKNIKRLDSQTHDEIITYTSHMPHILSTVFMNANRRDIDFCTAGSFRDITRVSDINVKLWGQLIWDNRSLVLDEIAHFKSQLQALEEAVVKEKSDLEVFLQEAKVKKISLRR